MILMAFMRVLQWGMNYSSLSKFWFNSVVIVMVAGLYAVLCVDFRYKSRIKLSRLDLVILAFLLHGLIVTFITLQNYSLFTSLNGFRTYFFGGIIYFLIRGVVTSKNDIKLLFKYLLIAITIVAVEMVWEYFFLNYFKLPWYLIPWYSGDQVGVFIENPDRLRFGSLFRPIGLLAYVHYSAYVIGLGVLVLSPFALNYFKANLKVRYFTIGFYLMSIALILSTTRSLILIIAIMLAYFMVRFKVLGRNIVKISVLVVFLIVMALNLNLAEYLSAVVTSEEVFYKSFDEDPLYNLFETNPMDMLFGRGFQTGGYERILWQQDVVIESGFHFNQISNEVHFLSYMDRTGLIGGLLFILKTVLACQVGIRISRRISDPFQRNMIMGLSLCPLLLLFSSLHILHSDVVMQFYSYIILGILGSLSQVYTHPIRSERDA